MEKDKKYTVYKITNQINNMIYVGVHITTNINDAYMGSGTNIKKIIKKYGKENFIKEILFIFNNKIDMLNKEAEIVNDEFIKREDTYNIILGGGFLTTNCVVVKDGNRNTFMVNINDSRYTTGELIPVSKDMITAKDINGKIYHIHKTDPRWISGELVGHGKGFIQAKDINGKKYRIDKNDIRLLNGSLIQCSKKRSYYKINKNKISMIDINGVYHTIDKNDPRILTGELFKRINGYTRVKDKDDNKFYLPKNDIRIISGELIQIWKKWPTLKESKKSTYGLNNSIGGKIGLTNKILGKRKYVNKDELELYLSNGWTKGWK